MFSESAYRPMAGMSSPTTTTSTSTKIATTRVIASGLRSASSHPVLRRIYEADPLLCPRGKGPLDVISMLVHPTVALAILRHLDVTDQRASVHARDPPAA
jgi:hypothetical protein